MRRIRDGLGVRSGYCAGPWPTMLIMYHQVLQYGQSQYVRQFGMNVSNTLVELEARVIKAPMLKYNPTSKQPNVVCTAYLSLMTKSVDVFQ